jgi:DNA-binding NtrC family response regulator
MKSSLIYVVEDNKVYNKLVVQYLNKNDFHNVKSFHSGKECAKAVKDGERPEIIIQDYFMEGLNGIEVLKLVKKISPATEFIFLTGNESTEVAVNSIKYGAYDYIIKDEVALDKAGDKINKILTFKQLKKRNKRIRKYMVTTVLILILIIVFTIIMYALGIFKF